MLQFLSHIPSYEPQETDTLSQMETKLKNQKVRRLPLCSQVYSGMGAVGGRQGPLRPRPCLAAST